MHCTAMCGGVIAGFNFAIPKNSHILPYALTYNIGRITSYAIAGAIAGSFSAIVSHQVQGSINYLNLISGIFLILLACYIGNWWRGLSHLEKLGSYLWQYVAPLGKRFVPFKHPGYALPYGLIWGWLPCGLVYSALTWTLSSGNSLDGALWMLAFGIGTLPATLLMAFSAREMQSVLTSPRVKTVIAIILFTFGGYSISQSLQHIL